MTMPNGKLLGSLKNELLHHRRYATRAEAEASIGEFIEIFYNRQRRHSRLGYLSPAAFADNRTRPISGAYQNARSRYRNIVARYQNVMTQKNPRG